MLTPYILLAVIAVAEVIQALYAIRSWFADRAYEEKYDATADSQ